MLRNLRSGGAVMLSHSVHVERLGPDGYIAIGRGGSVKPGEAIRLVSVSPAFLAAFRVIDPSGSVIFEESPGFGPGGNAWVDWVAPLFEGVYRVIVSDSNVPFIHRPRHDAETEFVVSEEAAAPPAKGEPGFKGILGDVKWIVLALGLIVVGSKLIPSRK